MAVTNPTDFLQNVGATHAAEPLRTVMGGLMQGVLSANSMKSAGGVQPYLGNQLKVQQTGSPSMSVDVLNGVVYISGTEGATQGVYGCVAPSTTNIAIAASNPTNPRIDLIVAKVQDTQYSGVTDAWSIVAVAGTPAGSPVPPGVPANSVTLAQVFVPANATSIVNANITDKRPYMVSVGGTLPVTSTLRPASPVDGQRIYETDTGLEFQWRASSSLWIPRSAMVYRYHGTGLQGIPASTDTALWMDTNDEVPLSAGSALVTKTGGSGTAAVWTFNIGGVWKMTGGFIFVGTASANADERVAWWAKSSDLTNTRYGGQTIRAVVGKGCEMTATATRRFIAGDAVSLACWQDTAGFLNIQNTTGSGFQPWAVLEFIGP